MKIRLYLCSRGTEDGDQLKSLESPSLFNVGGNRNGRTSEDNSVVATGLSKKVYQRVVTIKSEPKERKMHSCEECNYQSVSEGNLSRHRSSVHRHRLFQCQYCSKSFVSSYYLKQHVKSIHENEKLLCETCSKHFNTRQSLSRHKQIAHEGGNPLYTCSICDRRFSTKTHYEGHVNSHLEHRAFQCKTCGKSFLYNQNLRRHEKYCGLVSETGDQPDNQQYLCNLCGRQMKTAECYADHMKGKHGERNKLCACGKEFSWRSSYARHVKNCKMFQRK